MPRLILLRRMYASREDIAKVLKNFSGLSHRCEKILSIDRIEFYNSSIDSTPKRTAMTLESLGRQVVLILGGRSKGLDFGELIPALKKYAKVVIITGENAEEIHRAIDEEVKTVIVKGFEDAIKEGVKYARQVGVLLLSPASTSYDLFRNYAERGERFKSILKEIYKL